MAPPTAAGRDGRLQARFRECRQKLEETQSLCERKTDAATNIQRSTINYIIQRSGEHGRQRKTREEKPQIHAERTLASGSRGLSISKALFLCVFVVCSSPLGVHSVSFGSASVCSRCARARNAESICDVGAERIMNRNLSAEGSHRKLVDW